MAWRTSLLYKTSVAEQKVHVRMARKAADARKRGGALWWRTTADVGGDTAAALPMGSRVRVDHPEDFIVLSYYKRIGIDS